MLGLFLQFRRQQAAQSKCSTPIPRIWSKVSRIGWGTTIFGIKYVMCSKQSNHCTRLLHRLVRVIFRVSVYEFEHIYPNMFSCLRVRGNTTCMHMRENQFRPYNHSHKKFDVLIQAMRGFSMSMQHRWPIRGTLFLVTSPVIKPWVGRLTELKKKKICSSLLHDLLLVPRRKIRKLTSVNVFI